MNPSQFHLVLVGTTAAIALCGCGAKRDMHRSDQFAENARSPVEGLPRLQILDSGQ